MPALINKDLHILIIDDEKSSCVHLKKVLKNVGYEHISITTDGVKALELIIARHYEGRPVDLIFCDYIMPNMDGLELFKRLKHDEDFKEIPFVMVTIKNEDHNIKKIIQAGVKSLIVKPVELKTLLAKIEQIFVKV